VILGVRAEVATVIIILEFWGMFVGNVKIMEEDCGA
jgi:hypothetical protein